MYSVAVLLGHEIIASSRLLVCHLSEKNEGLSCSFAWFWLSVDLVSIDLVKGFGGNW